VGRSPLTGELVLDQPALTASSYGPFVAQGFLSFDYTSIYEI